MSVAVDNGVPEREFSTYQQSESGAVVRAHQVTEDTEGEVTTPGNVTRVALTGDWLIATERPDVYDVASDAAFSELGYSQVDEPAWHEGMDTPVEEFIPANVEEFDPNAHTAAEVRSYLEREDLDQEERDRVATTEREGRNRSTAFPPGV